MEDKKTLLSRREFLILGGTGLAAVAVLGACGPQPAEEPMEEPMEEPAAPPADESVTVDFLAWGDPADIPAWEEISSLYMERNPNVTVNVTAVADPGANFYPKLQTMIAGGTPPHVSSFQGGSGRPSQIRECWLRLTTISPGTVSPLPTLRAWRP
jgi:ABC-type glycerol-3-phosphate transport system substrate-binding protein